MTSKKELIEQAIEDVKAALSRLQLGDILAADILLKLAVDTLNDTGEIP